ncbi:hypothetical protein cyc_03582 [Cyclospora cayetanensis]|uniref:Uncharacterized protein n=1 Tax=Cyclospora cayetanensis TaxID=88456 RepID=A0A1D3CTN4_9EIME|nr:hypothetical protein cyc_03582 [Cyclospora cayetanensis]
MSVLLCASAGRDPLTVFPEPLQAFFTSDAFRRLMLDASSDSEYEVRIAKHAFAGEACKAQGEWIRDALDPAFSDEFFRYAKGGPFATSSGQSAVLWFLETET